MNKRFIIIILAIVVFVVSTTCLISFSENDLTKETAKELLMNAISIRRSFGYEFDWYVDDIPIEQAHNHPERIINKEITLGTNTEKIDCYFYPVKEGYEPENVKKLISDTFTGKTANEIISKCGNFFDFYIKEGEDYYYRIQLGNTISVGSKSEVYFLEEDFENIALYMVDGDLYSCNIIGHRIVNAVISVSPRVENFLVPVTFKFENGKWKINDFDISNSLFTVNEDDFVNDTLNYETISDCIEATIFNLYCYVKYGGYELYSGGFGTQDFVWEQNGIYQKFENGVDDIAVWENYFTKFCTIEVFEKIFGRQKVVRRFGNTLYHTQLYPTKTEFELEKIDESLITVLSQNSNTAVVNYDFVYDNGEVASMSIEFTNNEDGWVISGGNFIEKLDTRFDKDNPSTEDNTLLLYLIATLLLLLTITKRKQLLKNGQNIKTELF